MEISSNFFNIKNINIPMAPMPLIYPKRKDKSPSDQMIKRREPNPGPYSEKEIRKILSKVWRNPFYSIGEPFNKEKHHIALLSNGNIAIYNLSRTNDTVLIKSDGSADSIGSHHYREIAPKGKLLKLYEETKKDIEECLRG